MALAHYGRSAPARQAEGSSNMIRIEGVEDVEVRDGSLDRCPAVLAEATVRDHRPIPAAGDPAALRILPDTTHFKTLLGAAVTDGHVSLSCSSAIPRIGAIAVGIQQAERFDDERDLPRGHELREAQG